MERAFAYAEKPVWSDTASMGHGNRYDTVVDLLLVKDSIDPDLKGRGGWTPLLWAAHNGHKAVVQLLLAIGKVNIDAKDESGRTPL